MKYYCLLTIILQTMVLPSIFGQSQSIILTTQWRPQSQFAGYYVALEKGFYKDAGIDLKLIHPSLSNPALNRLFEGSTNIISLELVQAIECINQGMPLVNILQTSQQNSMVIVPRRDDINTLDDLREKRVGIWKAGFGELAHIMDNERQLNIEWIPFVNNVNLFVSGAIDATLAKSYNEYLQIIACGITPKNIFRFADFGYDIPEDGLYVTADYYKKNRKELQAFAEASKQGWLWAAKHPEETLDIVMKYVRQSNVGTNRVHQKRMLEEILRLQCESGSKSSSFLLSPEKVKTTSDLLIEHGIISREISYKEILGEL